MLICIELESRIEAMQQMELNARMLEEDDEEKSVS
jgi:hypothetical protein